jgi:outer membrane protein TolC
MNDPRDGKVRMRVSIFGTIRRTLVAAAVLAACLLATEAASAQQSQTPNGPEPAARTLTLKEAVSLALRNSRELQLARLRYTVAQRQTAGARAQFLPNLSAGSGVAYTQGFPLLASGGLPALFTASYNEAIFNPELRGELHAAEQRATEQGISLDAARDGVIVKAAMGYLELAKVRHGLDLMSKERESAEKILALMRERVAAGQELPIEETRAELNLARTDQRIAQLEDEDDSVSADLRDITGMPADESIEVSPEDLPSVAGQTVSDLVAQAMNSNADLKRAEAERLASEQVLKGQSGAYWPTLTLIGQYSILSRFNHYDEFFNKFVRNDYVLGVQINIPLFSAQQTAAVSEARANLSVATLQAEQERSQLSREVSKQARQAHELDLADQVAKLELQVAEENLHDLEAQFDQGRASLKDLEAAHMDESDKWLQFLDATFARQQAQLELLRTTGQVASVLQ